MSFLYEFNYTLRTIQKKLGFSTLCVIVIVIGFSICLPLYTFAKNYVYTTLPYPDGDRLTTVKQLNSRTNMGPNGSQFDFFQFNTLKEGVSTFEELGAHYLSSVTLSDGDYAQQYFGSFITANAFAFSATQPVFGRTLLPSDEQPDATPVVLIGYEVWQNYYGEDSKIIGQVARVNGKPYSIAGVMPEGYKYPQVADVWLPLVIPAAASIGDGPKVSIVGLLDAESSLSEASLDLASIMARLAAENASNYQFKTAEAISFVQGFANVGLFKTMGALALCIYLLVGLNVGNLLLIRANERVGELAIRSAMGASRIKLVIHVLMESFVICFIGTVLGLLVAKWILNTFGSLILGLFEAAGSAWFWLDFGFSANIASVAISLLLLLWLFSGGFAAWRASKSDISIVLAGNSKGGGGNSGGSITRSLVLLEVVVSFFLLVVCGSFLYSIINLYQEPVVPEADYFVTSTIDLNTDTYLDLAQRNLYISNLRRELDELSEIELITFGSALPGNFSTSSKIILEESQLIIDSSSSSYGISWVDTDYFQTTGFGLQQGRYFDSTDNVNSEAVAIVDDAFVKSLNFGESAIGKRFQLHDPNHNVQNIESESWLRIVGVIPHIGPMVREVIPRIYRPISQETPSSVLLIAKLHSNDIELPSELERVIKIAGKSVDRDISIASITQLTTVSDQENSSTLMASGIFGGVSLGTLLLAVIGVYGLVSRSVFARTREIGIRRAIGSANFSIVKIFLEHGTACLACGVLLGGGAAILVVNSLDSPAAPFNLISAMWIVISLVTVMFGGLIFWASYSPVRQVIAMEPGEALHHE